MSKGQRRLGIRNIKDRNDSPLLKGWRKFAMERDALWRNPCIFQGVQPDWEEALELMKYRIDFWVKIKSESCHDSVDDIVSR